MNACTCGLSCETQMIERCIPWMPWLYPWGRMANGMSNPCVSCRSLWFHCFDSGRPGHGGCFCIADHAHVSSVVHCVQVRWRDTGRLDHWRLPWLKTEASVSEVKGPAGRPAVDGRWPPPPSAVASAVGWIQVVFVRALLILLGILNRALLLICKGSKDSRRYSRYS